MLLPAGSHVIVEQVVKDDSGRYIRGAIKDHVGSCGFSTLYDTSYHISSVERIRAIEATTFPEMDLGETTQNLAATTQHLASQAMSFAKTVPELANSIPDLAAAQALPELSEDLYSAEFVDESKCQMEPPVL